MHDNGGHIVAPAIDTTTPSATVSPVERASRNLYNAYKPDPREDEAGRQVRHLRPRVRPVHGRLAAVAVDDQRTTPPRRQPLKPIWTRCGPALREEDATKPALPRRETGGRAAGRRPEPDGPRTRSPARRVDPHEAWGGRSWRTSKARPTPRSTWAACPTSPSSPTSPTARSPTASAREHPRGAAPVERHRPTTAARHDRHDRTDRQRRLQEGARPGHQLHLAVSRSTSTRRTASTSI
jgi:hypothetical protein